MRGGGLGDRPLSRGGRRPGSGPKPAAGVPRAHRVMVRLTDDERGWLVARAEEQGVSVGEALRELISGERGRESD